MYFKGASTKSINCYYFIGLHEKLNNTEVIQEQPISRFCLVVDIILTIEHFFHQIIYPPASQMEYQSAQNRLASRPWCKKQVTKV